MHGSNKIRVQARILLDWRRRRVLSCSRRLLLAQCKIYFRYPVQSGRVSERNRTKQLQAGAGGSLQRRTRSELFPPRAARLLLWRHGVHWQLSAVRRRVVLSRRRRGVQPRACRILQRCHRSVELLRMRGGLLFPATGRSYCLLGVRARFLLERAGRGCLLHPGTAGLLHKRHDCGHRRAAVSSRQLLAARKPVVLLGRVCRLLRQRCHQCDQSVCLSGRLVLGRQLDRLHQLLYRHGGRHRRCFDVRKLHCWTVCTDRRHE